MAAHLDDEKELGQERESDVRVAAPEEAQRLEIALLSNERGLENQVRRERSAPKRTSLKMTAAQIDETK